MGHDYYAIFNLCFKTEGRTAWSTAENQTNVNEKDKKKRRKKRCRKYFIICLRPQKQLNAVKT